MNQRSDDLWEFEVDAQTDDDGDRGLHGRPDPQSTTDDLEPLLDAWFRERSRGIETALLLEAAGRFLRTLVAEEALEPRRNLQARKLLKAIRELGPPTD